MAVRFGFCYLRLEIGGLQVAASVPPAARAGLEVLLPAVLDSSADLDSLDGCMVEPTQALAQDGAVPRHCCDWLGSSAPPPKHRNI